MSAQRESARRIASLSSVASQLRVRERTFTVAGALAVAGGVVGIAMVATLVAMYVGFALGPSVRQTALRIGTVNDALAIVAYGLVLP